MKTKLLTLLLAAIGVITTTYAQKVTTVTATNYDISDNLDLKAIASIFGESKDLEDFEYRLNNPEFQISNLDLNEDGYVDYIRVMEAVDNTTHLIVLQSVLGKDLYQDIATIEIEKNKKRNTLQVQIVGDSFLFGTNYIYEPIYYVRPIIFNRFWTPRYIVYHSPYYWGYYPTYYTYWKPYPVFRYKKHIVTYVNVHNTYNYVTVRNSNRAVVLHNTIRGNAYEKQNPSRSFTTRNQGYTNSYEMSNSRTKQVANANTRTQTNTSRTSTAPVARENTAASNRSIANRTNTSVTENRVNTPAATNYNSTRTTANTGIRQNTAIPQTNTRVNTSNSDNAGRIQSNRTVTPTTTNRSNTIESATRSQGVSPKIESRTSNTTSRNISQATTPRNTSSTRSTR